MQSLVVLPVPRGAVCDFYPEVHVPYVTENTPGEGPMRRARNDADWQKATPSSSTSCPSRRPSRCEEKYTSWNTLKIPVKIHSRVSGTRIRNRRLRRRPAPLDAFSISAPSVRCAYEEGHLRFDHDSRLPRGGPALHVPYSPYAITGQNGERGLPVSEAFDVSKRPQPLVL